jgi:hypothetical protein
MDTQQMTKDERSLLMYLETRAVDFSGRVDMRMMNAPDIEIARRWADEGFLAFGRLPGRYLADTSRHPTDMSTYFVRLSSEAWETVAQLRRERAQRSTAQFWARMDKKYGYDMPTLKEEQNAESATDDREDGAGDTGDHEGEPATGQP